MKIPICSFFSGGDGEESNNQYLVVHAFVGGDFFDSEHVQGIINSSVSFSFFF